MLDIERNKKTKTAVICPIVKDNSGVCSADDIYRIAEEACGLVVAMGQIIVWRDVVKLSKINAGMYFGSGTIQRFKEQCIAHNVELLVVNAELSPVQQRNLEKELQLKVIDRTAVILEIFGRRAQTKEGKLQVELAHLTYQRGRLVRSWTHLERQRGGGGFLGGPGETQIELDRRFLDGRIIKIKRELEKVTKTRTIQRSARIKVPFPVVALVGYTNAGKSTLFNYLTNANVVAQDMLFATLDPTMRKLKLGHNMEVILSDTVGFISQLPHELIMAFRATLEEVLAADVILHIIDVSNPRYKEQKKDVIKVLHELGLEKIEHTSRYIEVYNKVDALKEKALKGAKKGIMVSALSGVGVSDLLERLKSHFLMKTKIQTIEVDISDGSKLAEVYRTAEVLTRQETENKIVLTVSLKQ